MNKTNNILITIFFILIGCISFIFSNYYSLIESNKTLCIILFIFLIIINCAAYEKYQLIWNPIVIYSIFIISFIFYFFYISKRQEELNIQTIAIVIAAICSFVYGFFLEKTIKIKLVVFECNKKQLINILFYSGLFVFILEVCKSGYIPLIARLNGTGYYGRFKAIHFLHYLVMFESFMPCFLLYDKKERKKNLLKLFIAFFIIINTESRQQIILFFISIFITILLRDIKRNNKKINRITFIFFLFIIVFFILFGNYRMGSINVESSKKIIKDFLEVPDEKNVNLIDLWFNWYTSLNLNTFQDIWVNAKQSGFFAFGRFTFRPIISLFRLNDYLIEYPIEFDSLQRLGTYVCDIYLDFGFFGVIIINLLYGNLAKKSLMNILKNSSLRNIYNYVIICYVMIMFSFTNFYNNFFIFFALIIGNCFLNDEEYNTKLKWRMICRTNY